MTLVTNEMIAAAWAAWKPRHRERLGPGPGFVEAIQAALEASPMVAALRFYADPETYHIPPFGPAPATLPAGYKSRKPSHIETDNGRRARAALGQEPSA